MCWTQPRRSAAAAARGDSNAASAPLDGRSSAQQPAGGGWHAPEDSGYGAASGTAGPQWDLSGGDPLSGLPASFAPPAGYEPLGGLKEAPAWGGAGAEADPLLGRYGYAPPDAAGGAPDDAAWGPEDDESDDAEDEVYDEEDDEEGADEGDANPEERHAPAAVEGAEAWSEEALAWGRARGDGTVTPPRAATREQRWRERQARAGLGHCSAGCLHSMARVLFWCIAAQGALHLMGRVFCHVQPPRRLAVGQSAQASWLAWCEAAQETRVMKTRMDRNNENVHGGAVVTA